MIMWMWTIPVFQAKFISAIYRLKTTQRLSNFHFNIDCPHKWKGIKDKLAVNNHWVLERSPWLLKGELNRKQTPEPYWHRGLMGPLHFWEMYYNLGLKKKIKKNAIKQKTTKRCINCSSHKSISNISVFKRKFIKQPIHILDNWEQQLYGELFWWQSKTTNQTSICTFSKSKKLFPTPNLKKQSFFSPRTTHEPAAKQNGGLLATT